MKIWIISDTHFGHGMLTKQGHRPDGWEAKLLENWNKLVDEEDIVFHLGDFAIGKCDELKSISENIILYRNMLKGKIILIKGNHDAHTNDWYMNNGFEFCCDGFIYWHKGKKLYFTHIPESVKGDYTLNVHGHLHGDNHRGDLYRSMNWLVDVSLDNTNWSPISLDEIFEIQKRLHPTTTSY